MSKTEFMLCSAHAKPRGVHRRCGIFYNGLSAKVEGNIEDRNPRHVSTEAHPELKALKWQRKTLDVTWDQKLVVSLEMRQFLQTSEWFNYRSLRTAVGSRA